MKARRSLVFPMVYSALCLSLCMVLPLLTGQLPQIGGMLAPMHLPVLLLSFVCGPSWGAVVGLTAPLLRFFVFGAPTLIPRGVCMMGELFAYGVFAGFFAKKLPKKTIYIYISLILSMLVGRIVGGLCKTVFWFSGVLGEFGFGLFFTGYFVESLPGALLQLLVIPALCLCLRRARLLPEGSPLGGEAVTHCMKLQPSHFEAVKRGEKTVELRLYDEKRRAIRVGDCLRFENTESKEVLCRTCTALVRAADFAAFFASRRDNRDCGLGPGTPQELSACLRVYYSEEQEQRFGILAIFL